MKIYRRNTGEKYTPFNHFEMQTQVIFNPDGGCKRANCTLTTLPKGSGSHDEVHENSDQVFYIIQGAMKVYAQGKLLAEVREGDAIFVEAGDVTRCGMKKMLIRFSLPLRSRLWIKRINELSKDDDFAKSLKVFFSVIPVKTGIQSFR
jgi:quercetin dioxygenase-like cupin family protein